MASVPGRTSNYRQLAAMLTIIATLSLVLSACGAAGSAQTSPADAVAYEPTSTVVLDSAPIEDVTLDELPITASIELSAADGVIRDRSPLSPLDVDHPAVANLEPGLRAAVQQAASDAAAEGIEVLITSGWRSERYQQTLLDAAIVTYGSEDEARKWVSTPDLSAHVTGEAVDVGATDAALWFSQYGSRYGLCQTYANEIWHYELRVEAGGSCPQPAPDASVR